MCIPTMKQARYHHANHLAEKLRADITRRDNKLITAIQSAMDTALVVPSLTQSDLSVSTHTVSQPQVNTVQRDSAQLEMLKLIQQMHQIMISNSSKPWVSINKGGYNHNWLRIPRKTPDHTARPHANTSKYFWTHGACSHSLS